MKKVLGVIAAILLSGNVFSQGIEFQHVSFKEALAKAKAENKMVFMDCYTVWCGPCKALAKNVFPQKEVGDYFNANFINLKMDMEKGEGPALLKQYNVKGFPTLLFLDAEGNVLYKRVGGGSVEDIIADAKLAADPTERLDYVKAKYEEGDRSKAIVSKYIHLLRKNYLEDELKKVGAAFLSKLSNEDLLKEDNFKTYMAIGGDYKSEKFAYVVDNKAKFVEISDEQAVSGFIMMTYYGSLRKIAAGNNIQELDEIAKAFKKNNSDPQSLAVINQFYGMFYLKNEQFGKFIELKEKDIASAKAGGDEMYFNALMSSSMQLAMNAKSAKESFVTEKLNTWIKQAMELQPQSPKPYLCNAYLYKARGHKELALKNLNIAIDKIKAGGKDIDEQTKELKQAIEAM